MPILPILCKFYVRFDRELASKRYSGQLETPENQIYSCAGFHKRLIKLFFTIQGDQLYMAVFSDTLEIVQCTCVQLRILYKSLSARYQEKHDHV